jgi:hypothetical protein
MGEEQGVGHWHGPCPWRVPKSTPESATNRARGAIAAREIEDPLHRPALQHQHQIRIRPLHWVLLTLVVLMVTAGSATADLVKDAPAEDDGGARAAFGQLAAGWRAGQEAEVAALVHANGLTITSGQSTERTTHYSPSQAFYYFKNLFQTHETVAFVFDKVQGGGDSGRSHGMATWERRRPGQEKGQILKLMFVMARQGDTWMLSEIHTIR